MTVRSVGGRGWIWPVNLPRKGPGANTLWAVSRGVRLGPFSIKQWLKRDNARPRMRPFVANRLHDPVPNSARGSTRHVPYPSLTCVKAGDVSVCTKEAPQRRVALIKKAPRSPHRRLRIPRRPFLWRVQGGPNHWRSLYYPVSDWLPHHEVK